MSKPNIITWIILLTLTVASFALSMEVASDVVSIALILLTSIKVFLVTYQYMEVKKAHFAWLMIVVVILLIYILSIAGLKFF